MRKSFVLVVAQALMPAGLLVALPAMALDFSGYLRVGAGTTGQGVGDGCFSLPGAGLKYRLGNECDTYGEIGISQNGNLAGKDYKLMVMPGVSGHGGSLNDLEWDWAQWYLEVRNLDVAPGASFWIGKRHSGRSDVHIVDTFYTRFDGIGSGIDNIDFAGGRLNLGWFRTEPDVPQDARRINLDLHGIDSNSGGQLRISGWVVEGDLAGARRGYGGGLQHRQHDLPVGLENSIWLQFARGSAGLDGNFGVVDGNSGRRSWRLVESLNGQHGKLGGQAQWLYQRERDAADVETVSKSLGGRLVWGFGPHMKLAAELGLSERKPAGQPRQRLTKLTLAPTLSIGPGFWARPELRFFITRARWNQAANSAAGEDGIYGQSGMGDRLSGSRYGVQFETWF